MMRRLSQATLVVLVLVGLAGSAHAQSCVAVTAEFALTGLGNIDGNARNHELGVCLPHFQVQLDTACNLRLRPMNMQGATVSLLSVGAPGGRPNIPRATDPPSDIRRAVETSMGYYYLSPTACPASYTSTVAGARLLASDIADVIRSRLNVPNTVLTSVAFTSNGLTMSWLMEGNIPNVLSYTAIQKTGSTNPDISPFQGSTNSDCSLLDINPANDPANAILVGRVPRPIPGKTGSFICAIAPAGGSVKVSRSSTGRLQYAYTADRPTSYGRCPVGSYMYKLGAISLPGDSSTDSCSQCPRGSFAQEGSTLCAACPQGQYNGKLGQRTCQPCVAGYAAQAGSLRCMNCYYGRPYCTEGWSNNERQYTCNRQRLPDGYAPEGGYSIVRPVTDPTSADTAAIYSPMFSECSINTQNTVMAMNVSAECGVDLYVLGDLGRTEEGCSQNAEGNSISAFYTAPNILSGIISRGSSNRLRVGIQGNLGASGFLTQVFAAGVGARVPSPAAAPSIFTIGLTPVGFSYLGGGDNGQGQNSMVRGVAQAPCPPGTVLQMLNADGVSEPGEDPRQLLNNYCVPCGVGTFCDSSEEDPKMCPAGTFGPTVGANSVDACVNCPIGTYQDMDGSYECLVCDENTFASAPGATQCTACGDGYQVSGEGSNFCNPCSAGTYRLAAESETCQPCRPGSSSGQAAAECTICRPGTIAPKSRASTCDACPRGSFQQRFGGTKCDACPRGTYQDARAQPRCKVCPVGTFNNITGSFAVGACRSCSPGTAAPTPGSSKCAQCGAGFFSARQGSSSCSSCRPGTFSPKKGSTTCTPCPRGQFSDKSAATACTPCAIGFFASNTGSSRCMSCPAGSFTNSTGATTCGRCPAGTYSTRTAANSGVTCVACPAGSFSYAAGSTECIQCPEGQFAPSQGATNCQDCPLGTYSTSQGSIRCLPCKQGFTTSQTGSSASSDCRVRTALNTRKNKL